MARDNEEPTTIPDQAAHWWVTFCHGEASPAEKREFVEWATRAPEHVAANLRVARVHTAVSRADMRWPQTSAEELIREAKATPDDTVHPLFPQHRRVVQSAPPRRRRAMPVMVGLAACVLIGVCLSWFALSRPDQFQTRVGEQRSVMLADGSRITLNTNSRIDVRLRADHRLVELVRGEALFEVAHDAQRPFDVRVGNVVARAVGTQFDIDKRAQRTVVTVVEGRVAITPGNAQTGQFPVLTAGDRVVIESTGASKLEHGASLTEATAWTQYRLVFKHRPLGEIAEEFNRYNLGRIEIRSTSLWRQEVTGTFRSDDVPSFIAVLAGVPGVHVASDGAGGYVVTADGSAPAPK